MAVKKPAERNNNARATIRDVLTAVQGLNSRIDNVAKGVADGLSDTAERIDEANSRIDGVIGGQQILSKQISNLHKQVATLETTTNRRLHEVEADVGKAKRPWTFFKSTWRVAVVTGGTASGLTALALHIDDIILFFT